MSMNFFKNLKSLKLTNDRTQDVRGSRPDSDSLPPEWAPAPEASVRHMYCFQIEACSIVDLQLYSTPTVIITKQRIKNFRMAYHSA